MFQPCVSVRDVVAWSRECLDAGEGIKLKTSEPNAGESIDHRSESPIDSLEYLALRDKALA